MERSFSLSLSLFLSPPSFLPSFLPYLSVLSFLSLVYIFSNVMRKTALEVKLHLASPYVWIRPLTSDGRIRPSDGRIRPSIVTLGLLLS